jgi:hypothetical protein
MWLDSTWFFCFPFIGYTSVFDAEAIAFSSSSLRKKIGISILRPIRVQGISLFLIFLETVGRERCVAEINSLTDRNCGMGSPLYFARNFLAKMC